MEDLHREFCRRQHRMLGNYLAIKAWIGGLDCLIVQRKQLGSFLGLERFKGVRIEWLNEDLRPWFRYFYDLYSVGSFAGVFLSRKRFPRPLDTQNMTDEARIKGLEKHSIVAKKLKKMPTEADVISRPALWAVRLEAPRKVRTPPPKIYVEIE